MTALDTHDVADLIYTQQRSHSRHQVLAERRRRPEHVTVPVGQHDDLRCKDGRGSIGIGGVLHEYDTVDRIQCGSFRCHAGRRLGEDGDIDLCAVDLRRASDTFRRTGIQRAAVVFGYYEYLGHQSNPLLFNAPTSPATRITSAPE